MNPFDDFDLDIVKIMNTGKRSTDCGELTFGSGSGGYLPTITCFTSCDPPCPSDLTCPSVDRCPSQDPKCQTLEGRCE